MRDSFSLATNGAENASNISKKDRVRRDTLVFFTFSNYSRKRMMAGLGEEGSLYFT